jgi:hypothetical protein
MTEVLTFLASWWGLIALIGIFALKLIFDYENTVKMIRGLIFLAEEKARKEVLKTGDEKFQWVVANGYQYLPATLKLFLSEELFAILVQHIFNRIKEWAEAKQLTA